MTPWYRGFRGKIVKTTDNTYQVSGVAKRLSPTTLEITELPVRKWTEKFKLELEEMITNNNGVKVSPLLMETVRIWSNTLSIGLQRVPRQLARPLHHHDDRKGIGCRRGSGSGGFLQA
jgi:hypothetical protein